jgi:hypothetical protein
MTAKEVIRIRWEAVKKAGLWVYRNSDWKLPVVTSVYETVKCYIKKKKDERKRISEPESD